MFRFRLFLVLIAAAVLARETRADDPEIVRRAKAATAMIQVDSKRTATGFCINPTGVFVTSHHAVEPVTPKIQIRVLLNATEQNETWVPATVVAVDRENDLAVLTAPDALKIPALELGDSESLIETTEVTALGFPLGTAMRVSKDTTPSITLTKGRITSLRKIKGELRLVQLDASLAPGSSGGPVIDKKGRVVGVVKGGIPNTQMNFAVPSSLLMKLVEQPNIRFVPSLVPSDGQYKPREFKFTIQPLLPGDTKYTAELVLKAGTEPPRTYAARAVDSGEFRATAPMLISDGRPPRIRIKAKFPDGLLVGTIAETPITVGSEKRSLGEVILIRTGDDSEAVLESGRKIAGKLSGLDAVACDLGSTRVSVDLNKAAELSIERVNPPARSAQYTINVFRDRRLVGSATGLIGLEPSDGLSFAADAPTIAPMLGDTPKTIELPALPSETILAGSGRYLVFRFPSLPKVGVFDISRGRIIHLIPAPPQCLVAAGATSLVIARFDNGTIERWDLSRGGREDWAPMPVAGSVHAIAMGSASCGPVVILSTPDDNPRTASRLTAVDLASLRPIRTLEDTGQLDRPARQMYLRASPDGELFGMWRKQGSPTERYIVSCRSGRFRATYSDESVGAVMPAADGRSVVTSRGGIFNVDGSRLSQAIEGHVLVPAAEPQWYLALPTGGNPAPPNRPQGSSRLMGQAVPVAQLPPLPELYPEPQSPGAPGSPDLGDQIWFFPSTSLLITVPAGKNHVVLRRHDAFALLDKSGLDYLFVTSIPPRNAAAGDLFTYSVQVKSRRGHVNFKLESGPGDMSVSPSGHVRWSVPPDSKEGPVAIILSIEDASGQSIYHSFDLLIRAATGPGK